MRSTREFARWEEICANTAQFVLSDRNLDRDHDSIQALDIAIIPVTCGGSPDR